jgi:hypothetical protein
MSDVRTVYQKARIETAKLLGYGDDLETLTAEQSTRLDIACALRIALDDQAAKVLRGESADVAKLLSASEALAKLLPAAVLASPPPAADAPDPRETMWRTYSEMRARGALHGEGLDGLKLENERLRARVAELEAGAANAAPDVANPNENSGGKSGSAANAALAPNVVQLRDNSGRPAAAPAAPPTPAPPPPAAAAPAAPRTWDDTPGGQAWHAWRDAGGFVPD